MKNQLKNLAKVSALAMVAILQADMSSVQATEQEFNTLKSPTIPTPQLEINGLNLRSEEGNEVAQKVFDTAMSNFAVEAETEFQFEQFKQGQENMTLEQKQSQEIQTKFLAAAKKGYSDAYKGVTKGIVTSLNSIPSDNKLQLLLKNEMNKGNKVEISEEVFNKLFDKSSNDEIVKYALEDIQNRLLTEIQKVCAGLKISDPVFSGFKEYVEQGAKLTAEEFAQFVGAVFTQDSDELKQLGGIIQKELAQSVKDSNILFATWAKQAKLLAHTFGISDIFKSGLQQQKSQIDKPAAPTSLKLLAKLRKTEPQPGQSGQKQDLQPGQVEQNQDKQKQDLQPGQVEQNQGETEEETLKKLTNQIQNMSQKSGTSGTMFGTQKFDVKPQGGE